jgi:hypothetical protein
VACGLGELTVAGTRAHLWCSLLWYTSDLGSSLIKRSLCGHHAKHLQQGSVSTAFRANFRMWPCDNAACSGVLCATSHRVTALCAVQVYGVDVDLCDLLVGNLAEKKIPGFAVSQTAFIVFLLMTCRRLSADRFFTEHFNKEVYGEAGFLWVQQTTSLRDVLKRHLPQLERELPPRASAFAPYEQMPSTSSASS